MSLPSRANSHRLRLIDRPVYAGDIARAVEICCRDDPQVIQAVGGNIIEAGGPEGQSSSQFRVPTARTRTDTPVFTYRQIMELVLKYTGMKRFILSLPYFMGMVQGFFLEKLPENIFTLTRDQVSPDPPPPLVVLGRRPCPLTRRPGPTITVRQHRLGDTTYQLGQLLLPARIVPFVSAHLVSSGQSGPDERTHGSTDLPLPTGQSRKGQEDARTR